MGLAQQGVRGSERQAADTSGSEFFNQRILPVLEQECFECHSARADAVEGGLRLDSPDATRNGGDSGPSIVPNDPDESLLLQAINYDGLEMPPDAKLPDSVIRDFHTWVNLGAPDPREEPVDGLFAEPDYAQARQFWAFQPVRASSIPSINSESWPRGAIDHFVLAKLEAHGLSPAAEATKATLVRRLHFDLLGLPPTPEQISEFVQDRSADAYERLVDRLLASPHYGERWGLHWLDVVRYAETEGFEYDRMLPDAWRYRDYVVRSFNENKPYDRFLTEQVAGDELDPEHHEFRIAVGFHRLGPVRRNAGNQNVASSRNEVLTERTDIIGTAFLGLTIGCARCHDHKFDPVSQRDYYQLQAFLAASREANLVLASEEEQRARSSVAKGIEKRIARLKKQLETQTGSKEQATRDRILKLEEQLPPPLPTICSIVNDADKRTKVHVLRRGEWGQQMQPVGMRAPGVLVADDCEELPIETTNPRTELAKWLASPDNPLTPRVIVNRVWQHHFGLGLVSTTNDFGENGARPSHPDLLDYLAQNLIRGGWRLKEFHRQIVLSSTYRQSHLASSYALAQSKDPDNSLLWKFSRRRLSAEEIRDAMLAVSGQLNEKLTGRGVMLPVDQELVDQLYKPSQWEVTRDLAEHGRRSIYLVAKRNLKLPFMEVFDQPAALTSCARREQSTHAPQALELLNGRMVNQYADEFAARLRMDAGDDAGLQVERAYELATGRSPSAEERQLAARFIDDVSLREFCLAVFNLNDFLHVD